MYFYKIHDKSLTCSIKIYVEFNQIHLDYIEVK